MLYVDKGNSVRYNCSNKLDGHMILGRKEKWPQLEISMLVQHLEMIQQSSSTVICESGGGGALLIVAYNLLQHAKYLSEISAVFELHHKSIFTLLQQHQLFFLLSWSIGN